MATRTPSLLAGGAYASAYAQVQPMLQPTGIYLVARLLCRIRAVSIINLPARSSVSTSEGYNAPNKPLCLETSELTKACPRTLQRQTLVWYSHAPAIHAARDEDSSGSYEKPLMAAISPPTSGQ